MKAKKDAETKRLQESVYTQPPRRHIRLVTESTYSSHHHFYQSRLVHTTRHKVDLERRHMGLDIVIIWRGIDRRIRTLNDSEGPEKECEADEY